VSEWTRFSELLADECRLLGELNGAALGLTDALVVNDPDGIDLAERRVEAHRVLHGTAYAQRIAMQQRGFGKLTLAQVCARNGNLDVAEVLAHIQSSHEQDAKVLISPAELAELLQRDKSVKLVDVRSREEFEAVNIAGSVLLSQDVMRELMASGSNTNPIVVIDHAGKNGLDAAAYFMGHGLQNVRCLRGGIDAWAQEVEPKMRRYKLG